MARRPRCFFPASALREPKPFPQAVETHPLGRMSPTPGAPWTKTRGTRLLTWGQLLESASLGVTVGWKRGRLKVRTTLHQALLRAAGGCPYGIAWKAGGLGGSFARRLPALPWGGGGGLGSNSSPWGPAPLFFGLLTDPWGTREPQAGSSLSQRRSSSPGVGGDHLARREGWGRGLPPASTPVGTSSPVLPGPGWAGLSPCRGSSPAWQLPRPPSSSSRALVVMEMSEKPGSRLGLLRG